MINVTNSMYGAKGDGIADDTQAINLAIQASKDKVLYFPAGIYVISSQLKINLGSIYIKGDGKGISILKWTTQNGGIEFKGGNHVSSNDLRIFSIEQITLTTTKIGGTALYLDWAVNNANPQKKTIVNNIEIRGWDQYGSNLNGWENGIITNNGGGLSISHIDILGIRKISSAGIIIDSKAGSHPIRHFLNNVYILWHDHGILFQGPNEGIYFNTFEIVGCRLGIKVVPAPNTNGAGTVYNITNGHIDFNENGMSFTDANEVKISNIALFHGENGGNAQPGNHIEFHNCLRFNVSNSSFYKHEEIQHENGIWIGNQSSSGLIYGNQFDQIQDNCIFLDPSVGDCHASSNRASNVDAIFFVSPANQKNSNTSQGWLNGSEVKFPRSR